jgi:hypothetical protein
MEVDVAIAVDTVGIPLPPEPQVARGKARIHRIAKASRNLVGFIVSIA